MPTESELPAGAERARPPSVLAELVDCWQKLPHRDVFLILLAGWIALFQFFGNSTIGYVRTPSLFGWWWWVESIHAQVGEGANRGVGRVDFSRLLDSDGSFALIMPFVIAILFVWKREELRQLPK